MSSLAPERLRGLRRGRLGEPYLHVAQCDSTQELLRDPSLPEGALAVAEHQLAGRGRQGRSWEDAPGRSLLCSILLRPARRPLPQLSLVVALATAEAIEETLCAAASTVRAELKWPNDVFLDGHKTAGILLEAAAETVIVGIGVNVNQDPDELPRAARLPATSLRAVTGRAIDRGELLASLLACLERHYERWQEGGLEPLRAELDARSFLRGRAVRIDGSAGTAGGIAPDGGLELALDSGGRLVVESGEVELVP